MIKPMCTYNIEIEDSLVSRIRSSFKDDSAIKSWMQEQVVTLILQYESKTNVESQKKMNRRSALEYVKSLAVSGGEDVPADVSGVECLVDSKYV